MTLQDPALERARKRAKELREFYGHLITYVLVCTFLVIIDVASSDPGNPDFLGLDWAYWPIFGWGLFVLIHGGQTIFGVSRWEERKTRELYEREKEKDLLSH